MLKKRCYWGGFCYWAKWRVGQGLPGSPLFARDTRMNLRGCLSICILELPTLEHFHPIYLPPDIAIAH
ncbi:MULTISPECIES: hypothetical protein [Symbiopectobacterium]|uniref:hypothetical protein n=1 Tax=Symbiopectobacterium TaxID=801 RepID=UPI00207A1899|nr:MULTISPECIES: hypothetical protein [Symbiopectobacterium]MBT9430346.1 hypothetical protein [Candidatus Symbiopectobacterium endolongispinus]